MWRKTAFVFIGLLPAAAFFYGAAARAADDWTVSGAAGVFQYYDYDGLTALTRVGPAGTLVVALERPARAYEIEARGRFYGDDDYEAACEFRVPFYFHPRPARPYVAPAAGFLLAREDAATHRLAAVGVRVGGRLYAKGAAVEVDVFAAYRGRVDFDEDAGRGRPLFASELEAGATADWFIRPWLGLRVDGRLLWPGFFAEKHGEWHGPGVAPFVMAGPSFRF
ncbi:MAG: hypothetical protein PVH29_05835 [Candidatus Zixiibacteriota bacterium]